MEFRQFIVDIKSAIKYFNVDNDVRNLFYPIKEIYRLMQAFKNLLRINWQTEYHRE